MSRSERMSPVDTWWLRMDRPHNLMTIVTVWILEGPVALDRLENQLFERHLTYRRYRQKVEFALGGPYWRDDPHLYLAHHIKRALMRRRGRLRCSAGADRRLGSR